MRYCPYDRTPLQSGFVFCPQCGRSVAQAQPAVALPSVAMFEGSVLWEHAHYPSAEDALVRGILRLKARPGAPVHVGGGHLVMVLDVSGSMNTSDKYPLMRQALRLMLENLHESLCLTVVIFSSRSEILCEALPGVQARRMADRLIERMDRSPLLFGSTHISPGLELAHGAMTRFARRHPGALQRLYALTDGQLHDAHVACSLTQRFMALGVEFNSYGFGRDFALHSMKEIMGACMGGAVKHLRHLADIRETFVWLVQTAASVVAPQATLGLRLHPEALLGDVFCHRPVLTRWTPTEYPGMRYPVGSLEANRTYEWAFEIRLPEDTAPGTFKLGRLAVDFDLQGCANHQSWALEVPLVDADEPGPVDEYVTRVFASLEELRDQSPEANLAALDARIDIALLEGRDASYIDNMRSVADHLRQGGHLNELDDELTRGAYAECCTCVGVIQSSLPDELRDALNQGRP